MLTAGDSIIIADFGVEYETGAGRSGGARMDATAKPFKVNPLYSGDETNNFITRALQPALKEISSIVRREFT